MLEYFLVFSKDESSDEKLVMDISSTLPIITLHFVHPATHYNLSIHFIKAQVVLICKHYLCCDDTEDLIGGYYDDTLQAPCSGSLVTSDGAYLHYLHFHCTLHV